MSGKAHALFDIYFVTNYGVGLVQKPPKSALLRTSRVARPRRCTAVSWRLCAGCTIVFNDRCDRFASVSRQLHGGCTTVTRPLRPFHGGFTSVTRPLAHPVHIRYTIVS